VTLPVTRVHRYAPNSKQTTQPSAGRSLCRRSTSPTQRGDRYFASAICFSVKV
jgi:hypothetical protein